MIPLGSLCFMALTNQSKEKNGLGLKESSPIYNHVPRDY